MFRHFTEDEKGRGELTDLLKTTANSIRSVSAHPRVQVRKDDVEFFDAYIIHDDIDGLREVLSQDLHTESQRNMRRNVHAIIEGLDDVFDSEDTWQFVQYVVTSVSLVVVQTDGFESAHRIFGVLNTRGVPLTASDIFKARVLGGIAQPDRDAYARLWDQCLAPLGDNPDPFFQQLLTLTTRSSVKHGLMEEFTDRVLDRYVEQHGAESFIDNVVVPNAQAFCAVSAYVPGTSAATEQRLDLLRQYPSDEWKPVAMWTMTQRLGESERIRVLTGLERVFGAYTAAAESSSARGTRMVQILRDLEGVRDQNAAGIDPGALGADRIDAVFHVPDDIRQRAILRLKGQLPKSSIRKTLLLRAHYAATDGIPEMPRSIAVASLISGGRVEGVSPRIDVELWRGRLGALCLVRGKAAATRVEQAKSWAQIQEAVRPDDSIPASIVNNVAGIPTLTQQALIERHNQLVQLIARFWDIERDSDGVYLPGLTEEQLVSSAGGRQVSRTRRVRLVDVVATGILNVGDVLVWKRSGKGEEYRVAVVSGGDLQLPDGTTVSSPSAASAAVGGISTHALDSWKRESDGKSLREMWQIYEKRFGR